MGLKLAPKFNANDYILRICQDMHTPGALATVAMEVVKDNRVTDSPATLAGAGIYVAAALLRIQLRQRDVSKYSRISEPALRMNFEKLMNKIDVVKMKEYADKMNLN